MAIRPITDTLRNIRFGELLEDATKEMNELTQRVSSTGRQGSLTIKLTLKPGKAGQIEILDEISSKLPKPERGSTIFFATPEGNLQREDPRQMQIEGLRSVDSQPAELRDVAAPEAASELRTVTG